MKEVAAEGLQEYRCRRGRGRQRYVVSVTQVSGRQEERQDKRDWCMAQ